MFTTNIMREGFYNCIQLIILTFRWIRTFYIHLFRSLNYIKFGKWFSTGLRQQRVQHRFHFKSLTISQSTYFLSTRRVKTSELSGFYCYDKFLCNPRQIKTIHLTIDFTLYIGNHMPVYILQNKVSNVEFYFPLRTFLCLQYVIYTESSIFETHIAVIPTVY